MRPSRLLVLPALVGLLALASGAPALSGCDSGGSIICASDVSLDVEDVTPEGTTLGAAIASGDCLSIAYIGRLADGSGTFAQGDDRRLLYPSDSRLPRGFLLGMAGQRVGQTRIVTVPPNLGYGGIELGAQAEGLVDIPACSVLEFEITVNEIYQDARRCQ